MWAFEGGDLALRRVMAATALASVTALLAAGCGGTLEDKYRRGELTTTTTGGARSTVTTPATVAPTTTSTTPSTGNAAGQGARGERERRGTDGTIVESATRRSAVSPLGGRHR